ncbi:hypothetical protein SNEBB_000462 [Seison nebaliae]|nr:hypothetical protein SNEBB_000462 [Seison nebaliae]
MPNPTDHIMPPDNELKLICAQIIFRHGARTPLRICQGIEQANWDRRKFMTPYRRINNNYKCIDMQGRILPTSSVDTIYQKVFLKGGSNPGQLTSLGQKQLFMLGRMLRKRYVEEFPLISENYQPTEIFARSTNIVRTLLSCRSLLAGMYQDSDGNMYYTPEQQFIIRVEDPEYEILYPNPGQCRPLKEMSFKGWTILPQVLPSFQRDKNAIENILGIPSNRLNVTDLRDDLVARKAHNLQMPSRIEGWLSTIDMYATKIHLNVSHGSIPSEHRLAERLSMGRTTCLLVDNMMEAIDKSKQALPINGYRLFLYSCHDSSIFPYLCVFNMDDKRWPPFASDVTFELYLHPPTSRYYVKLFYCGQEQVIPGMSHSVCLLEKFLDFIQPYIMDPLEYQEYQDISLEAALVKNQDYVNKSKRQDHAII